MQPSRVHIPAGAPNTRWPKSIHRVARGLTVTTVDQPSPGWRSDTRSGWISSPTYIFRQSTQQQWEMVVLPATSWTALYPLTETKARSIGILLEWVGISPEVRGGHEHFYTPSVNTRQQRGMLLCCCTAIRRQGAQSVTTKRQWQGQERSLPLRGKYPEDKAALGPHPQPKLTEDNKGISFIRVNS